MTSLLLKLILAHLIGDFFLQPKKMVKHKEKHRLKSPWLYGHVLFHLVLMFLITWSLDFWKPILGITLAHLLIDILKLLLQNKLNKRLAFFIDQLLHGLSIFGIVALFYFEGNLVDISFEAGGLLLITCLAFITMPTSIIMKTIFSKWNIAELNRNNASLEDAGQYIGILERILVFIFIIVGRWEAVGFLITAKSVFRFGDLTASKERKLTEYMLIGTLISFGVAILTGLIYLNLLQYV